MTSSENSAVLNQDALKSSRDPENYCFYNKGSAYQKRLRNVLIKQFKKSQFQISFTILLSKFDFDREKNVL